MTLEPSAQDQRVLFLALTSRDAATTREMLAPFGIAVTVCRHFDDLLAEAHAGAGALLMAEEAVFPAHMTMLHALVASQPPWSDLPILILTRPGADSDATREAVRRLGNVTLLERPVRVATLTTAIRAALRARSRQYEIRAHLAERVQTEENLRRADRRKDEFLATLGHELRNPLAPLLAAVHLLKAASDHEPTAARVRPVMERQISHLVRLVNDLLEVSRITRGLVEVKREPIDLAFIVQSAIETSRPVIEAAGHHLDVDLPDRPVCVHGDAVRLTQVFANLLNNAAKYTNAGGHIWVALSTEDAHAVVTVRDDGIGIPQDHLSSVFEMFTQVDRSSRLAQGGLGIGLTLVRSLVEMHGGTVEARSGGIALGSEFVVTLPLAPDTRQEDLDAPASSARLDRRVLIVDDNVDAAETLGELLTMLGATVFVVHSGREALAALEEFGPDAVVLDIGMPEMDGYEVARRIRANAAHRHVLLIALTGWGQERDQRQSREAGFDHHVIKPPDFHVLRDLLAAR